MKRAVTEARKASLRAMHAAVATEYLGALLGSWDLKKGAGRWLDEDRLLYDLEDMVIPWKDIVYCVQQGVSYACYRNFVDYSVMAGELGFPLPDFRSWHSREYTRVSPETLEKLLTMKHDLEKAVEQEKDRWARGGF